MKELIRITETVMGENPGSHDLFEHLAKKILRNPYIVNPEYGGSVSFAFSLYHTLKTIHAKAGCDEQLPECR